MSDSEAGEHRRGVFEAITDTVKNAAHLAVSAVVSMERAILPEFDVNDTPAEQQPESSLKEDRKSDDVPTSETWWTPTWTKENNTWVAKAREPGEQQMSTFEDVVSPQGKSVIDNIRETLFGEKHESISPATKKLRDQLFEEIRQKGSTHDRKRLFKEIRSQRSSFAHKKLLSDIRNRKSNQNRRQVLSEIRDRRGATRALSPRTKQLREALFFEIRQRKFGASPATAKLRKQLFAEIRQIGVTGALSPATKQLRESLFTEIRQRRFMASPNTQRLRQALFNDIIERKFVEPASPHTLKLREQLFKEIRQRKPLEPEEAEAVHHIVERAQHDKKFMEAVLLAEDPLKLANKDVHKGNFQQTHLPRTKESISDTIRR